MKRTRNEHRHGERGYVMIVVLMVLAILLSAGLYGIRAMESDLKASMAFRRSEFLARAAEAGAAHRLSEISLASGDAGAALRTTVNAWQQWPQGVGADYPNLEGAAQYVVDSEPIATVQNRPPPGRQVGGGGQTTVWRITSFAVPANANAAGEHVVSVGVKLWSNSGTSYNN
jgi:hypothetical protein